MSSAVRVGIVGAGWWATQFHVPALLANPHARVTAIADPDPGRLRAAAEHFGIGRAYADPAQLFACGDVDAVIVATPHATHHPLAKAALESGLHVLVEKPFVLVSAHGRELIALAAARGLHLVVGCTYQFTRHAQAAREFVRQGRIGEPLFVSGLFASMVESYYRGRPDDYRAVFDFPLSGPDERTYSDPELSGGGQAQTQVSHAMNMVLWVTGLRVAEVHAFMGNRDLPVDVVDAIAYRLDNGATGTMGSTGSLRPGQPQQQELRYYGTEGFLLQELIHGTLTFHGNDGTVDALPGLRPDEVYPAGAPSSCLVDLVRGTGENLSDAETALATVEFIEAAYESARTGMPVRPAAAAGAIEGSRRA